jgi:hypothetical protein
MILIPTQNVCLSSWRMSAIVIGAYTAPYGKKPQRPLARTLRWDLAASRANIYFPANLDSSSAGTLVTQNSGAMPFFNLFFPTEPRKATDRDYLAVNGAVIRDETAQQLVIFHDVGFQPLIAVCGCILRDGVYFEKAHVPFTVSEQTCRLYGPLVIRDITPGDSILCCALASNLMYIDTTKREYYGGVYWLSVKK